MVKDDQHVQGGKKYESKGRGGWEAFVVDDMTGRGMVLAAYSGTPFRFDQFAVVSGIDWYRRADARYLLRRLPDAACAHARLPPARRGPHIMGMPHPIADWTVARVLELPDDGNRYEVIDGELLVSPAPSLPHQEAVQALYERLKPFVESQGVGRVLLSPADIEFDERTLVQPDLFVAPLVEGRRPRSWKEIRTLLLAVEVLSPTTARADRHLKRRPYQQQGVPEYWIMDLDARLIERWRTADERPEILAEQLEWRPALGIPPLTIDLPQLFAEILDA